MDRENIILKNNDYKDPELEFVKMLKTDIICESIPDIPYIEDDDGDIDTPPEGH